MNIVGYALMHLEKDIKDMMDSHDQKYVSKCEPEDGYAFPGIVWNYMPRNNQREATVTVCLYFNDEEDGEWFIEIIEHGDHVCAFNMDNKSTEEIVDDFIRYRKLVVTMINA